MGVWRNRNHLGINTIRGRKREGHLGINTTRGSTQSEGKEREGHLGCRCDQGKEKKGTSRDQHGVST
eukprot:gene19065-biopygen5831